MADNAIIGALRVVLGADSAQLEDGFKRAQKSADTFGKDLALAASAVGAAVAGMAVAIGAGVKRSIDEADKLGKMAQSIGIPVEELSRLKHAADLSGVGMEELGQSVGKLSKSMAEVAGGAGGPAAEAFHRLGISVKNSDGALRSSTEVMTDVAGRFGKMEDGAAKTALAMQLFGRAGAAMIPVLNQGADALRATMEEADQLGITISTKTAAAAEAFNDNLTRLTRVKDGLFTKISAELLPSLVRLSETMIGVAKDSDAVKSISEGIAGAFTTVISVGATLATIVARVGAEINALAQAAKLVASGEFSAAWTLMQEAGKETDRVFANLKFTIAGLNGELSNVPIGMSRAAEEAEAAGPRIAPPIVMSLDQISEAMKNVGTAAGQMLGVVGGHMQKFVAEGERARASVASVGDKIAEETARAAALRAADELSADQHQKMIEKINEKYKNNWVSVTDSVGSSLGSIAQTFGKENERMAAFAKAAAIAQAIVSVYQAAASALANAGVFPLNIAASAAVLAKGLALVATIKSQSLPHFQFGGSFKIPGGVGGGDRTLVPFMGEPGEEVTVRSNSEQRDERDGGRSINIHLHGEGFGEGAVRKLIGEINRAIGNGARLRVA